MSLLAEQNALQFAVPGGLIGVGTKIDPKLTRVQTCSASFAGKCWSFLLLVECGRNQPV